MRNRAKAIALSERPKNRGSRYEVREPWTVLAKRDPPRMFHVELFPVIPITGNKQL